MFLVIDPQARGCCKAMLITISMHASSFSLNVWPYQFKMVPPGHFKNSDTLALHPSAVSVTNKNKLRKGVHPVCTTTWAFEFS